MLRYLAVAGSLLFRCVLTTCVYLLLVFSQPIISKAKPQLLRTHFLPLMEKLKKVSFSIIWCLGVRQNNLVNWY